MTRTFKKWLSALLALLMVASPVSASFAEDNNVDSVPAPASETQMQDTTPIEAPTEAPKVEATTEPTEEPTTVATEEPAATPTEVPAEESTETPTQEPTVAPTQEAYLDHYDLEDVKTEYIVDHGTPESSIGFPRMLKAVYTDGSVREVEVYWTCVSGGYDPNSLQFNQEFAFEATEVGSQYGTIVKATVKFNQQSIHTNPCITINASARTITITGSVTTDQITGVTGYSSAYSIIVESNGSITGGTAQISNPVQNNGTISGGSFSGTIHNYGTLSGGTLTGDLYNEKGGIVTGGLENYGGLQKNQGVVTTDGLVVDEAAKKVTISAGYSFTTDKIWEAIGGDSSYVVYNDGTISGGSQNLPNDINTGRGDRSSTADDRRNGYINGGSFSGEVYANTISGGSFSGRTHAFIINGGRFSGFVGDAPNGLYALTINGGTFDGDVGTTDDSICVKGGTFNKSVTAYNLTVSGSPTFNGTVFFTVGDIREGTFEGQVTNNGCSISGGTFNGKVINNATIHGGTFKGGIENRGTIRSTGEFKYTVGTPTKDADGKIVSWTVTTHTSKLTDAYIDCAVENYGNIEVSVKVGPNFKVSGSGTCSVPAFVGSSNGTYTETRVPYGAPVLSTLRSMAPARSWTYASGAAIPQNAVFSLNAAENTFLGDESHRIENGVLIIEAPYADAPSAGYTSVRVTGKGSITGGNWTVPVTNEGTITGGSFKDVNNSGNITGASIGGEITMTAGLIKDCSFGVGAHVSNKTGGDIQIRITAEDRDFYVSYGANVKDFLLQHRSPSKHDWYRRFSPKDVVVEDNDKFRLVDNGASYYLKERQYPAIIWPDDARVILGEPLSSATYTKKDTNGTFSWERGDLIPESGTHDYYMVYTPYRSNYYDYTNAQLRKAVPVTAKGDVVIITITSKTMTYGGYESPLTARVDGEKNGKKVNYTLKREPGKDVGTYRIYAELGNNAGYEVEVVEGTLTITPRSISHYNNTMLSTSYPYTGDEIQPTPVLAVTDEKLVKGKDYTATYESNVNAGTGYMNVHGIGNYTGDARIAFTITKGVATVKVDSKTKEFGAPEPELTATVSGVGSNETVDYTLSRVQGEKAGTYTIKATPGYNPNFNVNVQTGVLTIKPKQIPSTITPPAAQPYNGAALTPKPVVKDAGKTLSEGVDYTLSYSNNVKVGTGTITVTGKGDYTGSQSVSFTISKGKATVTADAVSKIAGDPDPALTATVTGVSGNDKLNYSLKRKEGEAVGSYEITVTLGSNPNYDVQTKNGTFTIGQKNLPATITVADQTYAGKALTPKPVVKDGSKTLAEGVDYELSYHDNVNVGTATINLAGRGNFAGMRSVTFAIKGAPATITVDPASKDFGEADPQFTAKVSGAIGDDVLNYTLERAPGEAAGSYVIDAKLGSNPNYEVKVVTAQLTISSSELPANIGAPGNVTYTGSPVTPKPTVSDGSNLLREGVDYTLSYSNNVNVGTGTVTVIGKGNYSGSRSATFQITKANAVVTADPAGKAKGVKDDPKLTATVTGVAPGDTLNYTLRRAPGEEEGTYPITVTVGDNPNYNVDTNDGVFTIAQRSIPSTISVPADETYTGKAFTPKVTVKDGSKTLVENEDYTLSYKDNVNAGKATVIVAGLNGYAGAQTVSFNIKALPATITVDAKTKTEGEDDPELTAKVSGTINGETLNYTLSRAAGEKPGSYAINVELGNNPNYEIKVTGAQLVIKSLRPQAEEVYVGLGDKLTLSVEGATAGSYSFTSSDEGVATVDAKGVVTARKQGTAHITAAANGETMMEWNVNVTKAPSKVILSATKVNAGVGEKLQLSAKPDTAEDSTVTWKSSKTAVATVDANGLVTAKKAGTAKITVKSYNGKSATCTVTVKKAPTSIKLGAASVTLGSGDAAAIKVTLSSGSASAITYESSNPDVAKVENGRIVAGQSTGTAKITASTFNGKSATCDVTVAPAPTSITLGEEIALGVKQTATLQPKMNDGAVATLSYASSNAKIATVTSAGKVTAKKAGTATITVTTHNGLKAAVTVSVKNAPTKVTLSTRKVSIGAGQTYTLVASVPSGSVSPITWSSNKASVASVDANGVVTGHKAGKATITAKTYNGKKVTCTVTVTKAPTSIALSAKSLTLGNGDSATLKVTLSKDSSSSITYASSNPAVVAVDNGKVTAKGVGTAKITASTYNGLSETCDVTVTPAPTSIELGENHTLKVKKTLTLSPVLSEGASATLTFKTSNAKVATVSAAGKVTAKKAGTATITVTTYNGISDTVTITVIK